MYRPTISTLAALTAVSCAGGAFAQDPASAASNVEVKTLEKTGTALVGSAAVAASGPLASFGDIGVGCGINWTESAAFGGGLQAGSSTLGLGLGGGWNIATNNMTAGVGIGLPNDVKANISVSLDYKGGAVFRIGYSASLSCVPSQSREGTDFAIVCRTPTSDLA